MVIWEENQSGWLGVQVSPNCSRPMCRNRPLQAQAEAMLPGEDIADNSAIVDHGMVDARIDFQVVRAAEGMEAG